MCYFQLFLVPGFYFLIQINQSVTIKPVSNCFGFLFRRKTPVLYIMNRMCDAKSRVSDCATLV